LRTKNPLPTLNPAAGFLLCIAYVWPEFVPLLQVPFGSDGLAIPLVPIPKPVVALRAGGFSLGRGANRHAA
jgi:hypothetical protein